MGFFFEYYFPNHDSGLSLCTKRLPVTGPGPQGPPGIDPEWLAAVARPYHGTTVAGHGPGSIIGQTTRQNTAQPLAAALALVSQRQCNR